MLSSMWRGGKKEAKIKRGKKRDMGLSEQRSWKDKDHIAFFKKEELLMMSHYALRVSRFLLRKTPRITVVNI